MRQIPGDMDAISIKFTQSLSLGYSKNCTAFRLVQNQLNDDPYTIVINNVYVKRFPHFRALVTHELRSYVFKCVFSEDVGLHGNIFAG